MAEEQDPQVANAGATELRADHLNDEDQLSVLEEATKESGEERVKERGRSAGHIASSSERAAAADLDGVESTTTDQEDDYDQ